MTTAAGVAASEHVEGVGRARQFIGALASVAIAVFILVTTATGRYSNWVQFEVVLTLVLIALFALRPGPLHARFPTADLLLSFALSAVAVATATYMIAEHHQIAAFREGLPNRLDIIVYLAGTALVLEGARRAEGWILLGVVMLAIVYLLTGPYWGGLSHRGHSLIEVAEIAYSQTGIFGIALGSVVEIVYIFVIFGVALRVCGAGEFFDWISGIATLGRRSGSAQCAIMASALFGSINGSAPANVVANGAITIAMMSRAGYTRVYAAAVEASSSVVGQIMPPVMGVGAFIMAEITGIPYWKIMLSAIVPSFLFIFSLSTVTALEAVRLGIKPVEGERDVWTSRRVCQMTTVLASFTVLLAMLLSGYSVDLCGLSAIVVVVGLSVILPPLRPGWRRLGAILEEGGREGLSVAAATAAIGIIIAAVSATGIGIKLGQTIVALGSTSLLTALIAAAAAAILLGMGLPTAAAYLMVVVVAGQAMVKLGLSTLAAHMFVFYFAVLSAITPPVALAAFAAAAIAQVPVARVALTSMRLCLVAFLFPFLWAYHPELLLEDLSPRGLMTAAATTATLTLAVLMLAVVQVGQFAGRVTVSERILLAAGAVLIYVPELWTTIAGVGIGIGALGLRLRRRRTDAHP